MTGRHALRRTKWLLLLFSLLLILALVAGCSAYDPMMGDVYTKGKVYVYEPSSDTWVALVPSSGSSAAAWGTISGTLSDQIDLQSALSGKEPAITGGTALQFWRGDKTWHEVAGGGDMFKSVYDTGANNLVDKTENVDDGAGNLSTASQVKLAVGSSHAHSNKTILDNIQEAFTVSSKNSYDWLVANFTQTWKGTVDVFMMSTINGYPISDNVTLTASNVGAATTGDITSAVNGHQSAYAHADIALNTAARHIHSNKAVLDAIQEAFTTSLRTSYDWLVMNVTSVWKSSVDNHLSNTNNPHQVTKTQIGLSNVTNDAQVALSLVDAKGDLLLGIADNALTRLAVGADGRVLTTDSTQAEGVKWATLGGDSESVVVKTGDTPNSTTNLADAAGLTFNADANSVYIVEVFLLWDTSATTVGLKVSATATGSPTIQSGHFITDAAAGTPDSTSWNTNDGGSTVPTSASPYTTYNIGKVNAILKTSGSTSVWQLRFAAETTGTITIKGGSVLRYRKVA